MRMISLLYYDASNPSLVRPVMRTVTRGCTMMQRLPRPRPESSSVNTRALSVPVKLTRTRFSSDPLCEWFLVAVQWCSDCLSRPVVSGILPSNVDIQCEYAVVPLLKTWPCQFRCFRLSVLFYVTSQYYLSSLGVVWCTLFVVISAFMVILVSSSRRPVVSLMVVSSVTTSNSVSRSYGHFPFMESVSCYSVMLSSRR